MIEHAELATTTDELAIELAELKLHAAEGYITPERKAQIERRMAYISFELQERSKE